MTSPRPSLLFEQARRNGYALAAFNAVNLETAQAIVAAAEAERTAVILQISENAARYGGINNLFAIGLALKEAASVPVVLHFDHAERLESALQAVELGFDSVMLEGADLDPAENVRQLRILCEAAHTCGVVVEGELEVVTKGERDGDLLDPETIQDLAASSGCDLIAINIGSKHRMTEKSACLDLARLETIAELLPHPLVLHGSSGVTDNELASAVKLGISKVNVSTELMLSFTNGVRESLADVCLYDAREYLGAARSAMQAKARHIIRLLNRTNEGY